MQDEPKSLISRLEHLPLNKWAYKKVTDSTNDDALA